MHLDPSPLSLGAERRWAPARRGAVFAQRTSERFPNATPRTQHLSNDLSQVRSTCPEFCDMTESAPDPGRNPPLRNSLDETQTARHADPRRPERHGYAADVIGFARGDLLLPAPTSISSGIAAASFCAGSAVSGQRHHRVRLASRKHPADRARQVRNAGHRDARRDMKAGSALCQQRQGEPVARLWT